MSAGDDLRLPPFRFVDPPKCYWLCVREFLPKHVQRELELEWHARTDRGLSVAWLKSSLNQHSLDFQMLSFVAQPQTLQRFYEPNAAIRNRVLLKLIAVEAETLNKLNFRFEVGSLPFSCASSGSRAPPTAGPTTSRWRRSCPRRRSCTRRARRPSSRARPSGVACPARPATT